MADTMHLIDDYVKDDDRYQVKDVGRNIVKRYV